MGFGQLESMITEWAMINQNDYTIDLHGGCEGRSNFEKRWKKKARNASSRNFSVGKCRKRVWEVSRKAKYLEAQDSLKWKHNRRFVPILFSWIESLFLSCFYFSMIFSMYFRDTHFIPSCVHKKCKFQAYVLLTGEKSLYLVVVFGYKCF